MANTPDVTLSMDLTVEDAITKATALQEAVEEIFKAGEGKQGSDAFQQKLVQLSNLYDKSKEVSNELSKISTQPTAEMLGATNGLFIATENLAKAREELKQLTKQVNDLRAQGKAFAPTREFEALTERIRFLQAELNGSKLLMQEFSEGASKGSESAARAFKKEEANAARLSAELSQLKTVQEQMQAAGLDKETTASDEFRKVAGNEINTRKREEEHEKEIKDLNAEIARLKAEGKDAIPVNDADYKDKLNELNDINNRMSTILRQANPGDILQKSFGKSIVDIANHLSQLPHMVENAMDAVARTLPPYVQVIYSIVKAGAKLIVDAFQESFKLLGNILKNSLTTAARTATSAVKALVKEIAKLASSALLSPLKKLGTAISNIGKQANTSAPSLKQLGRAFLQYGLGARSLYRLINKLRTALFAGFADLAMVDQPFNAAMSSIISSLEYLRNAFASAFAPIIQAVAPALSTFINMVAQAVTWVGQLIALITGQPFMIAVPTFQDYAAHSSAGAAAAKQAAKAEKGRAKALKDTAKEMRTIAGFDDVEILKAPDDKSGSGGSGGGGGGGTGGGAGLAFQAAPMSEGLLKFAEMLKKIWETADAYELGQLVGRKLGDVLRAFHEFAPKLEEITTKVAKILASFLAGVLSIHDTFKMLGVAIADVINIVFSTIDAFLKTFMHYDGFKNLGLDIYYTIVNALHNIDWATIYDVFANLGIGIAQTLNEALTKPDLWEEIFTTLSNAVRALLLRAYYFVTTLQWGDIGTAMGMGINEGIATFPFALVGSTAAAFINGIFDFLGNAAATIHWDELGAGIAKSVMDFFEQTEWKENGQSLGKFIQGLFDALKSFTENVNFEEIAQDIVDFIDGFFDEFNWEENIDTITKLLNDLLDVFLDVVDKTNWEDTVNQIWNYIQNSPEVAAAIDKIWATIQTIAMAKLQLALAKFLTLGAMIITGIMQGILNALLGIGNWIKTNIFDPIYDWIKRVFNINSPAKTMLEIGSAIIEGIWKGITDFLSAPGEWLKKHVFEPIHGGLESAFGVAGKVASKIKDIGESIIGGLKKGAETEEPQLDKTTKDINTDMQDTLASGNWQGIGSKNITAMKAGVDSKKSSITASAKAIQQGVFTSLQTGNWTSIGSKAISAMQSGMNSVKSSILSMAKSIQQGVFTALQTGNWTSIGTKAITAVRTGMNNIRGSILSTAKSIQSGIYSSLNSGRWYRIGSNIVDGIHDGLRSGWHWLRNTVQNMAISLYNSACNALGIHSPSKLFADKVGAMIPAGIEVGIDKNLSTATTAIDNLTGSMISAASNVKLPPIAMGEIIPYNTNVDRNANNQLTTLQNVLDMLQSLESTMITRDELNDILADIMRDFPINLYIGDEKLARHVNKGNALLDRRLNPVASR